MYMGLVQGVARILAADSLPGRIALSLEFPEGLTHGLVLGASVSVEGVCLSVTQIDGRTIGFDVTKGTLDSTNLGSLRIGRVNIERSAKLGDEIGGHMVAGHVSGIAQIEDCAMEGEGHMWMHLRLPHPWHNYVFNRGFLAVNGCSLTVAAVEKDLVTINLIPETLRQTTFGLYKVGDHVNFEVDQQTMVMVDTVERTVSSVLERLMPSASDKAA